MKNLLFKWFLVFHLCIVFLGAGLFDIKNKAFNLNLSRYSLWTGGGFGYTFFSPNVGNQTVIKTYTITGKNTLTMDAFGTGNTMFDSRFSTMIHILRNDKAYELISRITASYVFSKYPGSRQVYIAVGEYAPETMAEYRANKKPETFREVYTGTYTFN